MAKKESTQHKLDRVRSPRVHITYDVEIGDAIEKKELPFVLGVVGDYSGQPTEALPRMKDRKFTMIDRDNFDQVMKAMTPRLAYRVDSKLGGDNQYLNCELNFNSINDFEPAAVVRQIEPLRKLLEVRERLSDLRNKMYGNEKLETLLNDVLANTDKMAQLTTEATRTRPSDDKA